MRLPTITGDWLRDLAELVDHKKCSVIRCDVRNGGVLLGIVEYREEEEKCPPDNGSGSPTSG